MPKVSVYSMQGTVVGEHELDASVFGVPLKEGIIHQVITSSRANMREPSAHTKTRAEVRGGGKKPWRQKGTGRARHGSIRSPIWKGGGVAHGPRNERVFTQKINKKMKAYAFSMALSDKVSHKRFILVDYFNFEPMKTKSAITLINRLPLRETGLTSPLFLVGLGSGEGKEGRAMKNIHGLTIEQARDWDTLDVVRAHYCITSLHGLEELLKRFHVFSS